MSDALANQLDLRLAWRRVKSDLKHRVFITHPYELLLIESDLDGWLAELDGVIRSGRYHPGPMLISEVPKGGGLIRPGSHLLLIDLVVYTACVGACFSRIHEVLRWSQGAVDFAYRLSVDPQEQDWLRSQFTGWQDFRQASLERQKDSSHGIFSDISAYYENIDIGTLISDLKSTGAPEEPIKVISACLNRWAQVQGRGIPQGNSASDILAKLYLNVVDLNLLAMGFEHLRYVDDVRIFVSTEVEAKKALVALVQLLRGRGLNVQSAKTEILTASEAAQDLEHVIHAVTEVGRRFGPCQRV